MDFAGGCGAVEGISTWCCEGTTDGCGGGIAQVGVVQWRESTGGCGVMEGAWVGVVQWRNPQVGVVL